MIRQMFQDELNQPEAFSPEAQAKVWYMDAACHSATFELARVTPVASSSSTELAELVYQVHVNSCRITLELCTDECTYALLQAMMLHPIVLQLNEICQRYEKPLFVITHKSEFWDQQK